MDPGSREQVLRQGALPSGLEAAEVLAQGRPAQVAGLLHETGGLGVRGEGGPAVMVVGGRGRPTTPTPLSVTSGRDRTSAATSARSCERPTRAVGERVTFPRPGCTLTGQSGID
jgi:hypothetical protein